MNELIDPAISACLLIPIYNHGEQIGRTVDKLLCHNLPLLIVDDGSDAATQMALQALLQNHATARMGNHPALQLFRLPVNSGKGAAVMHGLVQAQALGFSHALQIDADGQHDAADVPKFLALAAEHPKAVICGKPIYDASVPKGRLYGRYITHVWVWIETLSFAIADSMCGFRVYPLAATCALIRDAVREPVPHRMDFDTSIVVRLAWRGLRFYNLPTKVIYPADGLSHFDMWRDNWRITCMHTRLVCGMLWRLPQLLCAKLGILKTDAHA